MKSETLKKQVAWTFFTNHAHVVILLALKNEMTIREMAINIGITERAVQRILVELQDEGYLKVSKSGRQNVYSVALEKYFRHSIESSCQLKSIINVIKKSKKEEKYT